jgi:hypothetical protein
VHTPAWHESPLVHAFPSLHDVPFAAAGIEHTPVAGLHVPATWHASAAAHVTAAPPVQTPAWHESPLVHAFPSLHAVPFAATGVEHTPVDGSHVPATWHASAAAHVTAVPTQVPAWHESPFVHAFPSLHAVPFAAAGVEHTPVAGLHVPATWHASAATHVTVVPPVQTPAWHESPLVHAFPSLHAVPFAAAGVEHTPVAGLHVPATWHASAATHVTAIPAVHAPA